GIHHDQVINADYAYQSVAANIATTSLVQHGITHNAVILFIAWGHQSTNTGPRPQITPNHLVQDSDDMLGFFHNGLVYGQQRSPRKGGAVQLGYLALLIGDRAARL